MDKICRTLTDFFRSCCCSIQMRRRCNDQYCTMNLTASKLPINQEIFFVFINDLIQILHIMKWFDESKWIWWDINIAISFKHLIDCWINFTRFVRRTPYIVRRAAAAGRPPSFFFVNIRALAFSSRRVQTLRYKCDFRLLLTFRKGYNKKKKEKGRKSRKRVRRGKL